MYTASSHLNSVEEPSIKLIGEGYTVIYNPETMIITFKGIMRLNGFTEYAPIADLLSQIIIAVPPVIIVNLQDLQFLNSFGINMIFQFVINVRNYGRSRLEIWCGSHVPWQDKSLHNLERLMPALQLKFISPSQE